MTTAPLRRSAAVVVVASILALAPLSACAPIARYLPGQDPFLDQTPRSIAKAGFAEMHKVDSMRVLGSQETKKNGFVRVDLRLDGTRCRGSLDTPDGTIQVLKNADGAWFSADEDFWQDKAGGSPQADKLVRSYAGNWSVIGDKNPLLDLCDFEDALDSFALDKDDTEDTVEAGEVDQVGGADAVPVTGQDGKKRVTVWVAVKAPHRVLKMAPARDTGRPDQLFFEEFGAKVVADSPAKKDVVVLPGGA